MKTTKINVWIGGFDEFVIDAYREADQEARTILVEGARLWDAEEKKATFYPPHRIRCVEVWFEED